MKAAEAETLRQTVQAQAGELSSLGEQITTIVRVAKALTLAVSGLVLAGVFVAARLEHWVGSAGGITALIVVEALIFAALAGLLYGGRRALAGLGLAGVILTIIQGVYLLVTGSRS